MQWCHDLSKRGAARGDDAARPADSYTVAPGDTLRNIAARRMGDAASWRELVILNDVQEGNLKPGMILTIPHDPQWDVRRKAALGRTLDLSAK
jgi:hypothetical protein